MATPWDATTYDRSSQPQQAWASDVVKRLAGIPGDATILDVGCGSGRTTEMLLTLVPRGRVLAMDASAEMVAVARTRLGDRAEVWCQDVLELELDEPVDAVLSTAALHWVTDHDRMWGRLAQVLRPGGVLEVQCGGVGNIEGVRKVIDAVAQDRAPQLVGCRPGCSPIRQKPSAVWRMSGSPESGAGWKSDRPTPRILAPSSPRRSSPPISPASPKTSVKHSPLP